MAQQQHIALQRSNLLGEHRTQTLSIFGDITLVLQPPHCAMYFVFYI